MARPVRVGITQGDINGIGPETIIKVFSDERMAELCQPVIFGHPSVFDYYKKRLGAEEFQYTEAGSAAEARNGSVTIVSPTADEPEPIPGQSTESSGEAARQSLAAATDAWRSGEIDVIVTAPINKNTVHCAEFPFSGHTEYFASTLGNGKEPLMILFDGGLRVALVTTHLPLKEVAEAVNADTVKAKARILFESLKRDFGLSCPRMAVLALNPHAGDSGLLGTEEQEILTPAVAELRSEGVMAFGPFAADGFFGSASAEAFDAVLAMYHDQGLAPFKTKAMSSGVNFTAGLPVVRTSPDHGTGADIAGSGTASPDSMRQAVYEAIDIFRRRAAYDEPRANPLRKQYVDRSGDRTVLDLSSDEPSDI